MPKPQINKKTIAEKQEWFRCPHCHRALFPLKPDTVIKNLTYRCKSCKHDIEVRIDGTDKSSGQTYSCVFGRS